MIIIKKKTQTKNIKQHKKGGGGNGGKNNSCSIPSFGTPLKKYKYFSCNLSNFIRTSLTKNRTNQKCCIHNIPCYL